MKLYVSGSNLVTGQTFEQTFYDETLMNTWIAKRIAMNGGYWGHGEQHFAKNLCPENLEFLIAEEYENEIEPGVFETWVRLNPEYDYTIQDLTTEHEAELQAEADRATEIAELKQAYDIINSWTAMSDINLTFLKKFFIRILKEMKD